VGLSTRNIIINGKEARNIKELLDKLAKLFVVLLMPLIHMEVEVPKEIIIEDKTTSEQMRLIQQLDAEDRQTIFRLIEKMLTNKKFKEFFQKNAAAL
jgi:hypothetical protein